ncbi:SPOR domain-containing protein [Amphritea sp. HPY]|uniref:SPOR domain-containing protein n=1 Tax=Amphritea sp. HPY TaxID=3421652 RepID=UPI003D7F08ED
MVRFFRVHTLLVFLQAVVILPTAMASESIEQCRKLYAGSDTQSTYATCFPIADSGNGEASFILSNLYTQGLGTAAPDLKQAMTWLNRSADQNYGPACYNLAVLYERGDVVEQSYVIAFNWFKKGAELGHIPSQLKTGLQSLKGIGTQSDYSQALYWLDKAASGGSANAQVTLAILLSVSDHDKGIYWYKQAAQQDNSYAHYQLADIYTYGKLRQPVNLQQAQHHAAASIRLGRLSSQPLLDTIKARIAASGKPFTRNNSVTEEAARQPTTEQNPVAETSAENSPDLAESSLELAENSPELVTSSPEQNIPAPVSELTATWANPASKNDIALDAESQAESVQDVVVPGVIAKNTEAEQRDSAENPINQQSMLKDRNWLMAQPKQMFILQLVQLSREESVLSYLKKHNLEGRANYYRAHTNAGVVYVVLYGEHFASLPLAKRAAAEQLRLPAAIQRGIWYRQYNVLQKTYKAP